MLGPAQKGFSRGEISTTVTATLREAILDGTLAPGTWLRENEIAADLGVSRTPVRDAFHELTAEGLLTNAVNQGVYVTETGAMDVIEVYLMRESLEAVAFRLAARRAPLECGREFDELIPRMHKAVAARDYTTLSKLFRDFHRVVCDHCGNRYIERTLHVLQDAARRFPIATLDRPGRAEESLAEHLELAEAVVSGDSARAEALATKHMRHLSELRVEMLLV